MKKSICTKLFKQVKELQNYDIPREQKSPESASSVLLSFCSCGDSKKETTSFEKDLFHNIFLASSFTKSGITT